MKLYANLHTHSTHSDGGYSPARIARVAKWEGYGAVAVTDHDTVTGYAELKAECDKIGLECIFGAEFSSPSKLLEDIEGEAGTFHICGYHFDPEHPPMKKYLEEMSHRETDQTRILFERGVHLGKLSGIEWEEVLEYNKGITWLCNEHLFRALIAKGLMKGEDYPKFFEELFGEHRYEVPPSYPFKQEHEIIKLIHDAGGIAIVAHPHKQLCYMDALMEMGIDGLEIWHWMMTEEEREKGLALAYDKGLYISGGSDHNGYCSGFYEKYAHPEDCPRYAPPLTFGTTREYFEEIKNKQINR
ncbi:MAG: PHP domain-containing protein [Ruminococcaceae bacterium]|nr:PHP domain-containing protein [Oscillospiraceae bacterium]